MAEDPSQTPEGVTLQYARFFFGAAKADLWAKALAGLEENWVGTPGSGNNAIPATLALLEEAVASSGNGDSYGSGGSEDSDGSGSGRNDPAGSGSDASAAVVARLANSTDWRAQMYLKRGYYDAFVQGRYECEVERNQAAAYAALTKATTKALSPKDALAAAERALNYNCSANETLVAWRNHVVDLAAALNNSVGMEVVGNQDPSLNIATMDTPISDAAFLLAQVAAIAALPTEELQLEAISKLVRWTDPGPVIENPT